MPDPSCLAPRVMVRLAVPADETRLFEWRNDPWIVSLGASGRTVTTDEHAVWFRRALETKQPLIYLIEVDEEPCGSLRFDCTDDNAHVSIFLLAPWIGRGIGTTAFTMAAARLFVERPGTRIIASVVRSNDRSRQFFSRLGFRTLEDTGTGATIELELLPPKVPHSRPFIGEEEATAAADVVRSGFLASGPRVMRLEEQWAEIVGHSHAVAVGSGLGALRLALHALGVHTGDEVLMPAYACVALPNAVLALGATPVYCDITRGTWNIDPDEVRRRRSPRTRAVIAVHMFGAPADIAALHDLGIPVIEDCAHAVGHVGVSMSDRERTIVVGSFYATKLLGAGEGGILSTSDPAIVAQVRQTRDYADQAPDPARLNDKLTDVVASIALCQIEKLPHMLERRAVRAAYYGERLRDIVEAGSIVLPAARPGRGWYRYVVELKNRLAADVVAALHRLGVAAEQPVWDLRGTTRLSDVPVTNRAFDRLVSLPLYPDLSPMEQHLCAEALVRILDD